MVGEVGKTYEIIRRRNMLYTCHFLYPRDKRPRYVEEDNTTNNSLFSN